MFRKSKWAFGIFLAASLSSAVVSSQAAQLARTQATAMLRAVSTDLYPAGFHHASYRVEDLTVFEDYAMATVILPDTQIVLFLRDQNGRWVPFGGAGGVITVETLVRRHIPPSIASGLLKRSSGAKVYLLDTAIPAQ